MGASKASLRRFDEIRLRYRSLRAFPRVPNVLQKRSR